ncbi:MAG: propanediol utilization microcompartment protein PduB [Liquorilactobacillus ghanensis]|uniref:Propanediol utilization protein PduB n=1 Tax=Liquorilactobacillus ghanensis DSM 18630 TaxID=1423750 RepID=A0A0R1VKX4_9LACO|nr:propanediol utilization microcompartment protein PduB [Liquorilactobacillus ghanensis]KRM06305.1 propanediol utilization protein PduB [Liquorilactobacillus ghanensis DSM 18630]
MDEKIFNTVMNQVEKSLDEKETSKSESSCKNKSCNVTEFVGTGIGDAIGLVIANVDPQLHEQMKIDKKYRSIGILGARTGAGPEIMAIDEAVKATNTEVLSVELARDTKGGAGHGSLIIVGSEDVSDARRAIEVALENLNQTNGDVYSNEAGHLEFQYTARASYAIEKAFGAPVGKSFGLVCAGPAAIAVVLADTAIKAANVEVVSYASPGNGGTAHSNEVILTITGDSGAVRQAVIAARELGLKLLGTLGAKPVSTTKPYI